jgi:hypothetical protein
MATCNLWVENADATMRIRADQIIAIRAVPEERTAPDQPTWRLELVVSVPVGGSNVVPLCLGFSEDFPNYAGNILAGLIAHHIHDPDGGAIDSADEATALELNDAMFRFASFNPNDSQWPRQDPTPRPHLRST